MTFDMKEYQEKYRIMNKKSRYDYHKQWIAVNKKRKSEYNRKWREKNPNYHKEWNEFHKNRKEKYNRKWREKNIDYNKDYYKNPKTRDKRARLIRELGNKCQICGFSEVVNVHHIVPVKKTSTGKRKKDFALKRANEYAILCPNHHALVHLGKVKLEIKTKTIEEKRSEAEPH